MKANPELRKSISEKFLKYYSDDEVKKVIVPFHKYRETCLIAITYDKEFPFKKMRNLKMDNEPSYFFNIIKKFEYFKEPYNLYYSCAKYTSGLPIFYNVGDDKETVKERTKKWGLIHTSQMESFDLALDIDSPDFKKIKIAKEDTIQIYKYLYKTNKNMSIRFSGCGFHIVIPEYWKGSEIQKKDIDNMRKKAVKLKDKFSELLDTHVIEMRRVIKTPNSLVYKEGYPFIMKCKELTIEELEKFELEDYIYERI